MCWDQMGSGRCTKFSALEHFMSFCVSPRSEFREIICLEVLLLRQEGGLVRLPHFQASWGSLQWIYSKIPSQGPACNQTHLATPSGSLTSFVMKHLGKKAMKYDPRERNTAKEKRIQLQCKLLIRALKVMRHTNTVPGTGWRFLLFPLYLSIIWK